MIRWLRVVLPPVWTLVAAVFVWLAAQVYMRILEWVSNVHFFAMPDQSTIPLLTLFAILYAGYRVWVFHPALRPGYLDWLSGTPWTSRKPLPLGPIHLIWQDLVPLGAAYGMVAALVDWRAFGVVQAFLMAYVLVLATINFLTGERLLSYAVFFGVGGMAYCWSDPRFFFPIAAVCYGLALLALRQALTRFPWDETSTIQEIHRVVRAHFLGQRNLLKKSLGWPHDKTGPRFTDFFSRGVEMGLTRWLDVLLFGLLAGWYFYIQAFLVQRADPAPSRSLPTGMFVVFAMYVVFLVVGRVSIYCDGYMPPLSVLGRFAHGRLILPGYDQVFVAPLLVVMLALATIYAPAWTGIDSAVIVALVVTLTWWILFGMGPGLQRWRLTGNHRITRSPFQQKDMVHTS